MAILPINVSSISGVTPLDNNYPFVVEIQDSAGVPITRPSLVNPQTIPKTSLTTPFTIPFSFPETNYDLQNHKVVTKLRGQTISNISSDILIVCAACATSPRFEGNGGVYVDNITNVGLQFHWLGVDVYILAWEIYDDTNTLVRSGTVRPVSGHTTITFTSLPDDNYSLRIKGHSCISDWTALQPFAIGSIAPVDSAMGMSYTTQSGRYYQWRNTRNCSLTIQSDGKVTLTAPATRPTVEGGNTGNRYIFYNKHTPVKGGFLTRLLGSGQTLPKGAHSFLVMWSTAPDIDTLIVNAWPGQYDTALRGAQVEYISLGIK